MIEAARRAEFDFYQRGRRLGADRFTPMPDQVIRVISGAALGAVPDEPVATGPAAAIPAARPSRRRQSCGPASLGRGDEFRIDHPARRRRPDRRVGRGMHPMRAARAVWPNHADQQLRPRLWGSGGVGQAVRRLSEAEIGERRLRHLLPAVGGLALGKVMLRRPAQRRERRAPARTGALHPAHAVWCSPARVAPEMPNLRLWYSALASDRSANRSAAGTFVGFSDQLPLIPGVLIEAVPSLFQQFRNAFCVSTAQTRQQTLATAGACFCGVAVSATLNPPICFR
jgi:hypothetical protein